jgi:BirA family transcriptional regulator, biotin operon repressor / biotin---[acetyl-CoA-carboxylase] ligase
MIVESTASTNDDLLEAAASLPSGTVLAAEYQAAGRGRQNRTWISPARAGLTFSILLRPAVPPSQLGWLPLLAGVAVCDAVREVTIIDAALKWPNDLLVGDEWAKAGGILSQSSGDVVVIGIGVNVSTTRAELPVPDATSLELAGGAPVDRSLLLGAILGHLGERYSDWQSVGGDAVESFLQADYRARCATLNQPVVVSPVLGAPYRGLATDVDDQGRLLVAREDGGLESIAAADVRHLRRPTD